MEVPIVKTPEQKAQELSVSLSLLLQKAVMEVPMPVVMKILSNHQTDLQCIYVQALLQQQFDLQREAVSAEPAPES